MNNLLNIFPFIQETKIALEKQNKLLNKVTLTGKINALKEAGNLFEFTDKTVNIFTQLNIELVDALLNENLYKVTNELNFKANTAIDVLIRNLFERTADVGFLATDSVIVNFLTTDKIALESMKQRLNEYVEKYSVYNEIVVFDIDSNAKVNINENNIIKNTKDSIIQTALQTDDFVEVYKQTDIFKSQNKTLVYAQKIVHNGKAVGVLCLCFKFEDELKSIFDKLTTHDSDVLTLADKNGVIYSNNKHNAKIECFDDSEYKIIKNKNILVSSKTTGYQGYSGIDDWYVVAQTTPHYVKGDGELEDKELKNNYSLLNDTLKQIIEQANDLVDDIADVIINGELIAAKQRVYVLTPILDNLRDISSSLLQTITKSVYNLETVVKEAFIDDAKMASSLAIDLMDRNLYERANDCRWWALTPLFEDELSKENPNIGELDKTLTYINNLYTVYTDIFLFNEYGEIITSSNSSNIIGNKLSENYITQTLSNKKSEKYFVSEYEKNKLYDNRATYVYSASINNDDSKTCGIGVVFDSEPEFKAILDDSFPKNKKGFSVFVDSDRKIISTNSKTLNILDRLDIDEKYFINLSDDVKTEFIIFNNIDYLIAIAPSKGYREYKNSDNYTNMVYAITFLEI